MGCFRRAFALDLVPRSIPSFISKHERTVRNVVAPDTSSPIPLDSCVCRASVHGSTAATMVPMVGDGSVAHVDSFGTTRTLHPVDGKLGRPPARAARARGRVCAKSNTCNVVACRGGPARITPPHSSQVRSTAHRRHARRGNVANRQGILDGERRSNRGTASYGVRRSVRTGKGGRGGGHFLDGRWRKRAHCLGTKPST